MFYKLRFHSMDYYKEFYNENEQPDMKSHLEHVLFTLIQKAEQDRYLEEIFYTVTKADRQDFEILLAYPELINPSENLICVIKDHLNSVTDEELMSRLVESNDFALEVISSSEFFGKISAHVTKLFSVSDELMEVRKEELYDISRKYKELIKEHPELEID